MAGGVDVTIFEKQERYDRPYSGRTSTTLLERLKVIAKSEGESENQARTKLWLLGAQAYEWMAENRAFLDAFKKEHGLQTYEVLPKLLEFARQAVKAKR